MSGSGNMRLAFVLEAIDNATKKVRAVNELVEKQREPLNKARAATRELLREAGWDKLQSRLGTINDRAAKLGATVRGYAAGFASLTVAAGGVFFALKRTVDQVDRANDTAKKLGLTLEVFQRMGYAAQLNGSSQDEMGQALQHLSQNMVEAINGSKEAATWFTRVGIPLRMLKGMNVAQVFEAVADKFNAVGDAGQNAEKKIAVMRALMGRSGAELKQVLDLGSKGLRGFYAEADRLGAVVSGDTADAMADFNDNFDRLKTSIFGVMATIAKYALPQLDAMVRKFTDLNVASRQELGEKLGRMVGELVTKLPGFLSAVGQIAGALAGFAVGADRVANALGGWERVLTVLGVLLGLKLLADVVALTVAVGSALPVLWGLVKVVAAFSAGLLATPLGWVLAGLAALALAAAVVYAKWEPIKRFFAQLWDDIGAGVRAVTALLPNALKPFFGVLPLPAGGTSTGLASAPAVPSALQARAPFKAEAGGVLKIEFDAQGQPRVRELRKNPGSFLDFDVYAGTAMVNP